MTDQYKKLDQRQVPNAATTLLTATAGMQYIITHIRVVNTTGAVATVKLWHDGVADVNVILPAVDLLAGGWGEFDGNILLEPGDTLSAISDTNLAVTCTVYGLETAA